MAAFLMSVLSCSGPDGKEIYFCVGTRTTEIEAAGWSYETLRRLHNSPANGNADIYWMNADFIEDLRPDGF